MIGKIDHIGIAVASIEEAMPTYRALGLEIHEIEEVPHEGVRVAMLICGESKIELLEPMSTESPIAKFLHQKGPGIHHLCLGTDDISGDDQRLRDAGMKVLRDQPTRGAGGCWVQFVHPKSSGGVLLELSQSMDEGHPESPVQTEEAS